MSQLHESNYVAHTDVFADSYSKSIGAICSPSSDGAVIYSPISGAYYAVNEVAMSIWNHISPGATATQIAEALSEEYNAPQDILEEDVHATLKYLESVNLVERVVGRVPDANA